MLTRRRFLYHGCAASAATMSGSSVLLQLAGAHLPAALIQAVQGGLFVRVVRAETIQGCLVLRGHLCSALVSRRYSSKPHRHLCSA